MLRWWSRAPPLDDEDEDAADVALPAAAQLAQDATARHSAALGRSPGEERRRMVSAKFGGRKVDFRGGLQCLTARTGAGAGAALRLARAQARGRLVPH